MDKAREVLAELVAVLDEEVAHGYDLCRHRLGKAADAARAFLAEPPAQPETPRRLVAIDKCEWSCKPGPMCNCVGQCAFIPKLEGEELDAAKWRWLREQHEGKNSLEFDADGLPLPIGPTALAFTVFMPDPSGCESLVPVGCLPGELDSIVEQALGASLSETVPRSQRKATKD